MDTITQGLLGAAVGQAFFARKLGGRALVVGAVAGLLPDADVLVHALPGDGLVNEWRYHRGLTHSLFFAPVVGPLLGWLTWKFYRSRAPGAPFGADDSLKPWIGLWIVGLISHPLLDAFTTYGTMLFAPFSDMRVAWDAVGIIDPFYSVPLLLAIIAAGFLGLWRKASAVVMQVVLLATTAYLFYGWSLNLQAEAFGRQSLTAEQQGQAKVNAYPLLLQPWLRRIVVHVPEKVGVAYTSMLQPSPLVWRWQEDMNGPVRQAVLEEPLGGLFHWFTDGQMRLRRADTVSGPVLEVLDTRYGFGEPEINFWGLRAPLTADGTLAGPLQPFRSRSDMMQRVNIGQLWQLALGRPSAID